MLPLCTIDLLATIAARSLPAWPAVSLLITLPLCPLLSLTALLPLMTLLPFLTIRLITALVTWTAR